MFLAASSTDMAIYGILCLVGLAVCFFGYQLFRAWLFIAGLQAGFFVGLWLGGLIFKSPVVVMIAAILFGVILAFFFVLLIKVGGFLAGAGVMFLVALLAAQLFGITGTARLVVLLVAAVLGGILGVLTIRIFLVLATAVNGAYLAAASAFNLITGEPFDQILVVHGQLKTIQLVLILAAVVVLTVLGAIVQFRFVRRKNEKAAAAKALETPAAAPADVAEPGPAGQNDQKNP